MVVNSAVPCYSNLASELHRNYLFKFKLVLSSVWSNTHMMALLCEQITNLSLFNSSSEYGEIVKLQSALNNDYLPYFRANDKKFFFQNLCLFVHFRAVSLIHSALQWNAATLRKVLAPFSLSHVIDSCSLFISFISFLVFSLYFLVFF